jgi:hypothetical protein
MRFMRYAFGVGVASLLLAGAVSAVDVAIISYVDGDLNFTVTGTGTVTVTAQVDFKYISAKTEAESLARATSQPIKVKLAGEAVPATIQFVPPDGSLVEVEAVIFVNDDEKARQVFYYD